MKSLTIKNSASVAVLLATFALHGCGGSSSSSDTTDNTTPTPAAEGTAAYVAANNELKGDFSEDVTLVAGETYTIDGAVNFLEGTTLTIPAGTTLYGETGSSYLAINRGAQIFAEGTAADPIVFTSAEDIAGFADVSEQAQWGGLTILGQSTNNKGERTYEAGTQLYGPKEGVTIADDNSGVLSYVVIKYSGFEVEVDKELNGLSLASVGSGTTINNIAIIGSEDDAIEFWGGTVNVDGLYIYNAGDDSIDTDQGYTGTISNVYVEQTAAGVSDEIDSRCIEADGFDATESGPFSSIPVLQNAILDCVGRAVRLREGTGYVFNNVQVNVTASTDTTVAAMRITDAHTFADGNITTAGPGLAIKNNVDTTRLYDDLDTSNYFGGLTVWEDDDTTLTITEYDRSWVPGWTL